MIPKFKDLKGFVRLDANGYVVPTSLLLRKSKPKVGKWVEVPTNLCCTTTTTTTVTPT